MKYILWILTALLVLVVQGGMSVFGITLNLVVVLAYYAGIRKRELKGMSLGALAGLAQDGLSSAFLGPHMMTKGLIGYFSSAIYSRFFIWTPLLGAISLFLLTVADGLLILALRSIFDSMPVTAGRAFIVIFLQALFNAPFGIFLKPAAETRITGNQ